jgi:imidazolonepropionase-like amidohydrolase
MPNQLVIANVHVVDVAAGSLRRDCSVVIEEGDIAEVVAGQPGMPVTRIDGGSRYLAPGLIDAHVHFFFDGGHSPGLSYMEADESEHMRIARRNAQVALQAGITTMRDCGAPAPLIFDFRQDVATGVISGPHILCCGHPLTRPRGHCHFLGGEVASSDEVRRTIERQLHQGADFVKVMASGGGLTPGTYPHQADFPFELLHTATEVAHANGVQVTAHCHATEGIRRAPEAGLDMLEHVGFVGPDGYRYDEELTLRLRDAGVVVCPTIYGGLRTARLYRQIGRFDNPNDFAAIERYEGRLVNTRHFHRLGLKIIGGSDCGGSSDTPFDSLVEEILTYVEAGLSKAEALRTITIDAAALMNLRRVGEVRPGYRADLTLVAGNPLEDLAVLRQPLKVFKAGQLVHDREVPMPPR